MQSSKYEFTVPKYSDTNEYDWKLHTLLIDAVEIFIVAKERIWLRMITDSHTIPYNKFTYSVFNDMWTRFENNEGSILVDSQMWGNFIGEKEFSNDIEPIMKLESVLLGRVESILNISNNTDYYRLFITLRITRRRNLHYINAKNHGTFSQSEISVELIERDGITKCTLTDIWYISILSESSVRGKFVKITN